MDEGTYYERVQRVAHMMDVRTAFVSEEGVERAVETVKAHDSGLRVVPAHELHAARKIKEAIIHPDTGEKVFLPLRLSFIVPANLVLDTLMMSARGSGQVIAAQWLNQTYNALHYRANSNKSNSAAEEGWSVFQAYVGATVSSVGAALYVERAATRAPAGAAWAPYMRRLGPLAAVAAADVLNVGLMRRSEYTQGVNVRTEEGEVLGKSRVAGGLAVSACIAGRVAAATPILTIPPLLLHRLERTSSLVRGRPWVGTAALMGMVAVAIQVSVPLTFGLFRQTASVPSDWLEPQFAARAPGQRLVYNKGL